MILNWVKDSNAGAEENFLQNKEEKTVYQVFVCLFVVETGSVKDGKSKTYNCSGRSEENIAVKSGDDQPKTKESSMVYSY